MPGATLLEAATDQKKIRTYNYPDGRITDHRINLKLNRLNEVMAGDIGEIIQSLITEHQADQLAEMAS